MWRLARGLALGAVLAASPALAEPDGYEGLQRFGGDTHVHGGTPADAYNQSLPSWNPSCTDCPSVWCTRMYAFARQAGYDWVVSTNHDESLPRYHKAGDRVGGLDLTPPILAWWKSAGRDWKHPAHPQDVYPTHPAGFPLYGASGGHTDDHIASLASCADAATADGRFVAFLGVEYTAAPATPDGCRTEAVGCGGHKTVIFPRLRNREAGERACSGSWGPGIYDDQCRTLGDVYRNVAALGGVVHVAHPNFGPKPGLEPFQAQGERDNGGIHPELVVGAEVVETSPESKPGLRHTYSRQNPRGAGLNVGGILAHGHRIHPVFGSDLHFRPSQTAWPFPAVRTTECWARALTRADLLDAMRAHRCYWAHDRIELRFGIESAIMGASLPSDAVDPEQGLRVRLSAAAPSAAAGVDEWILIRGTVRKPPVAPSRVSLAADAAACSGGCTKDLRVRLPNARRAADYEGFYYVVLRRGGTDVAVSAPIWIEPPRASAAAAARAVSRRRTESRQLDAASCDGCPPRLLDRSRS
jgi:hypothetical protein